MIERDGYKFEMNKVRGVHCSVHGCKHKYASVIVTWPLGAVSCYCRRCYLANRNPVPVDGAEPRERRWPRYDDILADAFK